jgi:predicted RNA polymerase sigma factor
VFGQEEPVEVRAISWVTRAGKAVDLLRERFSEALDAISSKYEEHAKKFGELKAECGKLEEELRLARVVESLMKYPSECEKLPLDYDVLMLGAVMNHCRVKGGEPEG